jgi:chromosome segregation ATPase
MSKYADAATTIRKAAVKYEQMIGLAAELERIGSLEDIARDCSASAEAARTELAKAKEDLAKTKAKIEEAREKAAAITLTADEDAAALLADRVKDAEVAAAGITKKAQDDAAEMIAQASTIKAKALSELGGLTQAIEAGRLELKQLTAAKLDAEKATAEAEKKLASLREKLKAMLG